MNITEAKEQLMKLQNRMSAYMHAQEILYFDEATIGPEKTDVNRAHTMAILAEEQYKITTGEETVALLEFLDANQAELDEKQKRMVYLMLKNIRQMQCVPMEEFVEFQELLGIASGIWRKAKLNNDFAAFLPTLQKIFDTQKKFAGYFAPDKDPYDYWLGEYEDGLDTKKADAFFDEVRVRLVPLIRKITNAEQVDASCLHGDFPIDKQEELTKYLMDVMGVDPGHCNCLTTEHPFTISMGSHYDVRITTHYLEDDFSSSMFSVVHESGHALYDMNSADEFAYTVLDGGVSMGIHESQSRFYENIIGRSKGFIHLIFPKLCELFPEKFAHVTEEELYKAVNRVQPSLIRTEADEVTYALHVMVRYELEKKVFRGELEVKDLPEAWNRLYKEYLGVDVPNDREGVLQDSHWSGGSIGYFPSYALGSAYGACFLEEMKKTIDVDACIAKGDFAAINEWNREQIWQYGCLYKPGELLLRVLGKEFTPDAFLDYLEKKYTEIYDLQ